MQAFILAGGFATRLWPLTERRAKPLLPIAGKPIISYIVDAIPKEMPITVSTNAAFAEDFDMWKKTLSREVRISIEDAGKEDQKLGALGAIALWTKEHNIQEDILLLAGDNYAGCNLRSFVEMFRGKPLVAGHDIGSKDAARQFGTIVTKEGSEKLRSVVSFEEKPADPKSTIVSTGWWILPKECLGVVQEYAEEHPDNVGGIFEEFLRRSIDVDCFIFEETWKDIGSFDAYLSLHQELVGSKHIKSARTTVDTESILEGAIDLGEKTRIEKSHLRDCIVFGETSIRDCVLERCIIDKGCVLEGIDLSDKMLRMDTVLRRT